MSFFWQIFDFVTGLINPRKAALEFEQELSAVEGLIDTSEDLSQCDQSLRNLNKLHRTLRRKDRRIYINHLNLLQAKFDSKISSVESLSRSDSNINIEYNDEMDRRRYGSSRSRKNQQPYQRPSPKSKKYYNKHASCGSTIIDMEAANGPTNQKTDPISEATKKLPVNKQQTFHTQSKQELNNNAENNTYNLRSKTYSDAVRTDNQQKRLPEMKQDPATEQERKQSMDSTYQAFSNRTNENEISNVSERHQNCYNFDQDPREVAQKFGQHPEHQRQREQEEEEAALQKAEERRQREVEEQMKRQEREKLQQHQRQLDEQKIKEKERQLQQQVEEINNTEIVDISDKFIEDSIKKHPDKNNLEYFQVIRNKAKSFEDSIEQFKGDDYMEYFILHENLMQLIEIMDRIRCEKDETLFPHKIEIIDYIKQLIENLNARNQS